MPKTFLIDTTRCTACRGCQLACKEWHDLPANETKQRGSHQNPPDLNPNNLKIVRFRERLDENGTVIWNFFPDQCRHCLTPICKDVADMSVPGAIVQDTRTGAVLATEKSAQLSEEDAQAVTDACPYNIPRRDPRSGRLTKCDMCIDRVSAGMLPVCVKTCPTGTMAFGEREEVLALGQKRLSAARERFPKAFLADFKDVNVLYLLAEEKEHYYEYAAFM
ncbi:MULTISPECIES: 4Fe-4S dicluster domain-containing protein [unclassified Desulfovibrio]|uniref:4Fe-4S dicluster domain-containing protein n=1 Tax=unclassified Desulfovibrio TaxID=2593640 RepID=UPI000F5F9CB2|nr:MULTISPECIES: 4Fe-4S dicluster domain-containing protein [unclassified Desulfovibrio]RRD69571.1 formate dehydrogenase [Desulfovibrio sp. OH1209_COT-279]RRD86235.1 formate dehydrogenase [Desulfovibrio sp. OH1186_COT-070]